MSSDPFPMALKSIEARGFIDVDSVGEDFGMGILAVLFLVLSVDDGDDSEDEGDGVDDKKALGSYGYGEYKCNLGPWLLYKNR